MPCSFFTFAFIVSNHAELDHLFCLIYLHCLFYPYYIYSIICLLGIFWIIYLQFRVCTRFSQPVTATSSCSPNENPSNSLHSCALRSSSDSPNQRELSLQNYNKGAGYLLSCTNTSLRTRIEIPSSPCRPSLRGCGLRCASGYLIALSSIATGSWLCLTLAGPTRTERGLLTRTKNFSKLLPYSSLCRHHR